MKASYFIEVDTYWQNAPSFFVGPFESRDQAEAWQKQPGDNVWLASSMCGGDIRSAWRIYDAPLSRTQAKARGMHDSGERANVLPASAKPDAESLARASRSLSM